MNQPHSDTALLQQALRAHRAFGMLPDATLIELAATLNIEILDAGQPLGPETALTSHLLWLLEGTMDLLDADGHALVRLQANDLFGLGRGEPLGVEGARATAACRCVRIDQAQVAALCSATPALAYFLPAAPRSEAPANAANGEV